MTRSSHLLHAEWLAEADAGHPSRAVRGAIGLFCAALLGAATALVGPAALAAGSPLTWAPPVQVDHQAPFRNHTQMDGVSCPGGGLCVAVDQSGDVVTSTDPAGGAAAWTETEVDSYQLDGVSCPSIGFCVAVDGAGDVVTSADPTGGAAAWTVTNVDGSNSLYGVSCPSSDLCVAVDGAGDVVIATDPTGGRRPGP